MSDPREPFHLRPIPQVVPTGQCLAFPEIRLRTYEVEPRDGVVVVRV